MELEQKIKLAEDMILERKAEQDILRQKISDINLMILEYDNQIGQLEGQLNLVKSIINK